MTPVASVTRLRIRHWAFLPPFALQTLRAARQAARAEGFLGGSILADRASAFWTLTMWRDEAAMRAFMHAGAHQRAMPNLVRWCDEAATTRWPLDTATLPSWAEAERELRARGRASRVRAPSAHHQDLSFPPPAHERGAPITPARVGV